MPRKVEIEFDVDFSSDAVVPTLIGRLLIGGRIARLYLRPNGTLGMVISENAVKDGSIVLVSQEAEDGRLYGYADAPR